ncbi:short-chain dehydrogenase [Pseudoclavibacter sp. RFBJ3]|uniref:SDR family NAD(P)-dependent oxidoreductase n=1 Tax=unclassified Pseudoclavibacter TaxID=2615177 RepID=UPI000CE90E9F|nr:MULTISPECIES: SDR family NAD(P)-dependent oxidoreductase [unclassified Pseudoclavibacter]PPF82514.1 short-chain dehydrogenase [Pseudoclavibacter sp. RFBJ5]PPF91407.1 short-chain dehydrogenase [Pseudoclavibacter sp. RFBJ3]PPF96332.1 short-chain dehydrogenase [Pseudoclavibacter sp. RFBH5]PPG22078.1 short-chain dehydrogenase [Pseudoclavibacter sp. RFBI4]
MTSSAHPLTGDTTIGEWLTDPTGGVVIREILAQGGQDASSLTPVAGLPLSQLVELSQGKFPQEMVDAMIARANSGEVTPAQPGEFGPAVDHDAPRAPRAAAWVEATTGGRFDGKTVIVTGAGSGIGKATASRIAREGGRVIAVDVSAERLAALVSEHDGADIVTLTADITDDTGVARILEAAGSRIDGLANIAGIMDNMTPVGEVSDEVWNRVFAVNVTGTMKLMRAVVPAMLAVGTGAIVNVASEAALRGSAAGAAYTASKHAVAGLTKSSAFMYGPSGLRINAVAPGPVATNIEARFDSELGGQRVRQAMALLPTPTTGTALAASITFLLSDDGVNINGVILPSDGGWSAA